MRFDQLRRFSMPFHLEILAANSHATNDRIRIAHGQSVEVCRDYKVSLKSVDIVVSSSMFCERPRSKQSEVKRMTTYCYAVLRVACSVFISAFFGLVSLNAPAIASADNVKPGMYRLLVDNDRTTCARVHSLVNREAANHLRIRMRYVPEAIKWIRSTNPSGVSEEGDLMHAIFDINDDGVDETVFKTRLNFRGMKNHALYILDKTAGNQIVEKGITLSELNAAGRYLSFLDSGKWIARAQKLHGAHWEKYLYDGLSWIRVSKIGKKLTLLAWNPVASRDDTAKILAFTLSSNFEPQELCLLGRVCPCSGCGDPSAAELLDLVAAPRWCRPTSGK